MFFSNDAQLEAKVQAQSKKIKALNQEIESLTQKNQELEKQIRKEEQQWLQEQRKRTKELKAIDDQIEQEIKWKKAEWEKGSQPGKGKGIGTGCIDHPSTRSVDGEDRKGRTYRIDGRRCRRH